MTEQATMTAEQRLEFLERRMSLLLEGGSGSTEEDSSAEINGFKTMILGRWGSMKYSIVLAHCFSYM